MRCPPWLCVLLHVALAPASAGAQSLSLPIHSTLIDDDAIADGVQGAFLPGRMQRVSVIGPIGKDHEIWIDGAHNPHGARVLADCLRELDARASRPVVLGGGSAR